MPAFPLRRSKTHQCTQVRCKMLYQYKGQMKILFIFSDVVPRIHVVIVDAVISCRICIVKSMKNPFQLLENLF